jgi:hypothetical protein
MVEEMSVMVKINVLEQSRKLLQVRDGKSWMGDGGGM